MIELIVEGKDLAPILREMERSPAINVIGPHISSQYPGAQVDDKRVAVKVNAGSAGEARDLIATYLPPHGGYAISPALI